MSIYKIFNKDELNTLNTNDLTLIAKKLKIKPISKIKNKLYESIINIINDKNINEIIITEEDCPELPILPDVKKAFQDKGCEILSFRGKTIKIKYRCKCNNIFEKIFKDFNRDKDCRSCSSQKLRTFFNNDEINDELKQVINTFGGEWKIYTGCFVSSEGQVISRYNLTKILTDTDRVKIGDKRIYISRLVALAFKIENYDKLKENDTSYVITHIDGNYENNNVNNLKIVLNKDKNKPINKPCSSDKYYEKKNFNINDYLGVEYKIVPELPKHCILKNGDIFNGKRMLTGSKHRDNYIQVCLSNKTYYLHRLICYAFNPIEGYNCLEDYKNLQVNHKDGNKLNNSADNLEWNTNSENMKHSYDTKLNKKTLEVLQYSNDDEFIKEWSSIAEASRETKETEYTIRKFIKENKEPKNHKYIWKVKDENKSKEYSKNFS